MCDPSRLFSTTCTQLASKSISMTLLDRISHDVEFAQRGSRSGRDRPKKGQTSLDRIGPLLHSEPKEAIGRLGRRFQAVAVHVVEPAVVGAEMPRSSTRP